MLDYNNLFLWHQQAQTCVAQGEGDKLADLNEQKDLVPYEEPGLFARFTGWKVERHTAPLNTSLEKLTEKAVELGERVGIRERIAVKPGDKEWDELTLEDLADSLDRLLLTPQVQLVKAKGAFDDALKECGKFLQRMATEGARDRAIESFDIKLEEVYQQLNHTIRDPQANLDRLKDLLENDVMHAFRKLGVDPEHFQAHEAEEIANSLDRVFKDFTERHQRALDQVQQQQELAQQPAKPVSKEAALQKRFDEMLDDLVDETKIGPELNQRIRTLAEDAKHFVMGAKDPVQALQWVKDCCVEGMREVEAKEYVLSYSTKPMHDTINMLDRMVVTEVKKPKPSPPPARVSRPPQTVETAVAAKVAPSALQGLMDNISDYALGLTENQSSAYCQKMWLDIQNHFATSKAPLQQQHEELAELRQFVFQQIKDATKGFIQSNISDDILMPLLSYIDALPKPKPRTSVSPSKPVTPPPQTRTTPPPVHPQASASPRTHQPPPVSSGARFQRPLQVTAKELLQEKLIIDYGEYTALQRVVPPEVLTHTNIISQLKAYRQFQSYNPGFTNQDFGKLVTTFRPDAMRQWVQDMDRAQNSYQLMGPVKDAVKAIAWANGIPNELLPVADYLDMNALSTPYIMQQLNTFAMFERGLQGRVRFMPHDEMAFLMNRNLLVPLHMGRMAGLADNTEALLERYLEFPKQVLATKRDTTKRHQAYETEAAKKHLSDLRVRAHQVPPNGDCFYSAIGYLVGEPMRKVRQRCHWAAEDILLMHQGQYPGDLNSPYAKRIKASLKHVDIKRIEKRFKDEIYLTPNFEQKEKKATWGEEEDLALLAIAYNQPFVPLNDFNGYAPICGYGVNGNRYETFDFENPSIMRELIRAEGKAPLLLIASINHWDALVADR